jgi:hypothetical protein
MGLVDLQRVRYFDAGCAIAVSILWFFINVWYFKRFYELEAEQSASLGPRAEDISTNEQGKSAMSVILGARAGED